MKIALALMLFLTTAVLAVSAATGDSSKDCRTAIEVAEKFLPTLKVSASDQKLIKVENLYVGANGKVDENLWRITFKDRHTLGKGGPIGKGGEIFIEVNVSTKKARFLGAGE